MSKLKQLIFLAIQWTSDVLVKASTIVISNEKCQDSWGSMIVSTMICTSRTRGGVCNVIECTGVFCEPMD